jgi:hypothetical protein
MISNRATCQLSGDKGGKHPYSDRFYHVYLDTSRYGASCRPDYSIACCRTAWHPRARVHGIHASLGSGTLSNSGRRSSSLRVLIMLQLGPFRRTSSAALGDDRNRLAAQKHPTSESHLLTIELRNHGQQNTRRPTPGYQGSTWTY